ncbi:MAG: GH3 auxin-responsive promoter family protein [Bacteroidia bacterium]|nr:GH3 auxin-responsive promoter family protein [Bacteroidia bacterium]
MLRMVHRIASWILKRRTEHVSHFMENPIEVQQEVFHNLVTQGSYTEWGKTHAYDPLMSVNQFRERVPISTYEELCPWIEREFNGEKSILWPGKREWFSKSSGTTNDKSKYIPVTEEALEDCHFRAGQDMLAMYLAQKPDSKLFTGKGLSIGGSLFPHPDKKHIKYGDVSAVITENLPRFYELVRTPRKEVAFMTNWEEKIEAMVNEAMEEDITSMAGVPTWTMVLLQHMIKKVGGEGTTIRDIWPNIELYLHGGVSFEPYREQFKKLIPGEMNFLDCYNASEGYFAFQHDLNRKDLLLLLDYGIFYEFIPTENLDDEFPQTHTLDEVEIGKNYAMVISTNAGLWRYSIGDTVTFTSKYPFLIKITGRTKHFINAYGEELMVDNAERGITKACNETGAIVSNFTAGPIYFKDGKNGGHEWLIEFEKEPENIRRFGEIMDEEMKRLNSDYEAKRQADIAIGFPTIHVLPRGSFHDWMKKRGKLGGQNKVPRLANHRKYVEDILEMIGQKEL